MFRSLAAATALALVVSPSSAPQAAQQSGQGAGHAQPGSGAAQSVATPAHEVVRAAAPFEIRDYPALAVARTPMGSGVGQDQDEAFRRLFGYISGENTGSRDISMTAPVLQQPGDGARIDMTAPVLRQPGDAQQWEMMFVLPADMTAESAPEPTDDAVTIGELPARRVAVVTFDGTVDATTVETQTERLLQWLDAEGLEPAGAAEVAVYDEPGTPPDKRRNEIIVPLPGS